MCVNFSQSALLATLNQYSLHQKMGSIELKRSWFRWFYREFFSGDFFVEVGSRLELNLAMVRFVSDARHCLSHVSTSDAEAPKTSTLRLICDLFFWKGMRRPDGVAVVNGREWWGPSSVINRFGAQPTAFLAKTFKDRVFGSTRSRGG